MTKQEAITGYIQYIKVIKNYSNRTVSSYDEWLKVFVSYLDSQSITEFEAITLEHILSFQHYLSNKKYKGQYLSVNTQALYIIVVKNLFTYYYRKTKTGIDPIDIEIPKGKKRIIEFLTIEQVDAICKQITQKGSRASKLIREKRDRAIIEVLYSTGLRVSELCNLNKRDINFDTKTFTVIGKGSKQRIVFISDEALYYIKLYLAERIDQNPALFIIMFRTDRYTNNDPESIRIRPMTIRQMVHELGIKAQIPFRVHPHMFRHTFATDLLRSGASLDSLQKLLGHSQLTTTQIYSHVTDNDLKETFNKYHTKRGIIV
jgi:site-specific recombinase XerD